MTEAIDERLDRLAEAAQCRLNASLTEWQLNFAKPLFRPALLHMTEPGTERPEDAVILDLDIDGIDIVTGTIARRYIEKLRDRAEHLA